MAKKKQHGRRTQTALLGDSTYLLKLVLYLVVGAQWLRLVDADLTRQIPLPIGLVVGIIFASRERFRIDRKIEYAILIVSMFIGLWSQMGIYVRLLG
jgi:hypothetical protein